MFDFGYNVLFLEIIGTAQYIIYYTIDRYSMSNEYTIINYISVEKKISDMVLHKKVSIKFVEKGCF